MYIELLRQIGQSLKAVEATLDMIARAVQSHTMILKRLENKMTLLDDMRSAIADETRIVESVKMLIQTLISQVGNAPDMAAVAAVVEEWKAKNVELADMVVANTPAAQPPAAA